MASAPTYIGSVRAKPTTSSIVVDYPIGTQAGDLVIGFMATGGGNITTPTGWSKVGTDSSYDIYYKFVGSETSVTFNLSQNMASTYGYVFSSYRGIAELPHTRGASDTYGTAPVIPSYTPSWDAITMVFQMNYNGGSFIDARAFGTIPSYMEVNYIDDPVNGNTGIAINYADMHEPAGQATTATTISADVGGGAKYYGWVSFDIAHNEPPSTVISAITESLDPRVDNTVTWSYSDPDADPQISYQLDYRVVGGTWASLSSGTGATSYVIPANILTDETDYEIRVRVSDGYEWGEYSTTTFSTNSWTTLPATTSSQHSAELDITGYDYAEYELEVRVSDQDDTSDWSLPATFAHEASNNYIYINGVWKPVVKKIYQNGTWVNGPV